MKTTFTKATSRFGCYATDGNKQNRYLPKSAFTIADVLNADVSLRDKAWFIRYNCELTVAENRQFAIGCALCVLPIYENKYPGNAAPRKAIEAAQAYLAGTLSLDDLMTARRAAYAAYAAYAAAYAAAAAADAAYAAADAAAYAAADAAAYAADAADAAPNYKDTLLTFFKEFVK